MGITATLQAYLYRLVAASLNLYYRWSRSVTSPVKLEVHDTTKRLTYYLDGKKYTMCFPFIRRPCAIVEAKKVEPGGHTVDVTADIIQKLGPGKNFYGIPTTPQMLGYNQLLITYRSGEEWSFLETDVVLPRV